MMLFLKKLLKNVFQNSLKIVLNNVLFSKGSPTYKVTHIPPWFKGWELNLPWLFVLLRHSEIKLHRLDSPELALQVGNFSGWL